MNIEESVPDSMADRIANQFENQPEPETTEQPTEAAAPEESEAQPEVVEVEFGGKSYQVPPELKDALMREVDYTKKTSAVAEKERLLEVKATQLKAAESEREFQKAVNEDITAMQRIDFQLEQYKTIPVANLSEAEYRQLREGIDSLKEQRQQLSNKVNAKYQEWQGEQQKLGQEMMTKAQEAAQKAIPNWSPETQKQIKDYALAQGFDANELSTITDPRVVKVLWQASQFQKLSAKVVNGKVTTSPAVKPGSSNPMPQHVKDGFALQKQLGNKQLNSSQKAKVIERELMNRF